MKRTDLDKGNLTPNFIGSWEIETTLCEEIIEYFEKNKRSQHQDMTSKELNLETKDRQDIALSPNKLNLPENTILWRVVQDHVRKDLFFLGTEFGVYFNRDNTNGWVKLS